MGVSSLSLSLILYPSFAACNAPPLSEPRGAPRQGHRQAKVEGVCRFCARLVLFIRPLDVLDLHPVGPASAHPRSFGVLPRPLRASLMPCLSLTHPCRTPQRRFMEEGRHQSCPPVQVLIGFDAWSSRETDNLGPSKFPYYRFTALERRDGKEVTSAGTCARNHTSQTNHANA